MKRRIAKKKVKQNLTQFVHERLRDTDKAVIFSTSGLAVDLELLPDATREETKKFISTVTRLALRKPDDVSCFSVELYHETRTGRLNVTEVKRSFFSKDTPSHRAVTQVFNIIEVMNFFWDTKQKMPNLITLILMTQFISGSPSAQKMSMDEAFVLYSDKRVSLNKKLSHVTLEHLVSFRRALRILMRTGKVTRSIFNTIWFTDKFREILSREENGSLSYLPSLKPEENIP